MANVFDQLSKVASGNALATTATKSLVNRSPSVTLYRERAAAALHDGMAAYDTYSALRPWLFYSSILGMIASGYMLYKRRKIGSEAIALYSLTFAVSAATAWFTAPWGAAAKAQAGLPPGTPAGDAGGAGLMGYLDQRVAKLKAADPQFADKTIKRFIAMPGVKEEVGKLDPILVSLLV